MKVTLDVTPAVGYLDSLRQAPQMTRQEVGAGIEEASALYVREVKEATPLGVTGLLRQSVIWERADDGADIAAKAFSPLQYAAAVELGTKPHYPPIEPLQDWVRKKLDVREEDVERVARLIQFKIGKKGTKAQSMFGSTLGRLTPQIAEIVRRSFERVLDRLRRGN